MYHINKEITASGENIALKNTARHYLKNFDILGNSVQEGTPSIEYEAPIESVGDNINEFNKDDTSKILSSGVDGNTLKITSNESQRIFYIECEPNTNYTISKLASTRLQFWDSIEKPAVGVTLNSVLNTDYNFTGTKKTVKTSTNAKYLVCYYYYSSTDTLSEEEIRNSIKICKGTSTGAYSPYGQGSIGVVNCNKNFWAINNTSFTPTATSWHDFNGVSNMYNNSQYNKSTAKIKLKAGNYYMSYGEVVNVGTVQIIKIDGSTNGVVLVTGKGAFTLTEDSEIMIRLSVSTANVKASISNVQIALGTEEKEYIEHQSQTKALYTQQPFRAIGDVKDRFIKQDGVGYEEHPIVRHIFTGNENWALQTEKEKTNVYKYYAPNVFPYDRSSLLSNYFIDKVDSGDNEGIVIQQNQIYLAINKETAPTVEDFKAKLVELYNAGIPLYVDYVLATPTLIECTPEQVEQLESIEKEAYSYDEVTHIYSTDEVSPYFEVTAYQRISEEFKTRLKEGKITRGYLKVLATDTLPEIIINENNYLKDLKIEELRYVPEEGIIGGTVAKRVSGNFNNVDSSFDIQDREIEVYLGVELEDETTEYIKYGTYIVQRPEDDQVNDNTSFEALDYMIKFNQEYKDRITYPCTLKQLLDDIIDQAGVNSKVVTFANSDFVVENNQFEQGSTLRDVLKAITQVAFNWSRIDADDNLVMDFEIREETDEELGTDDYFSFKKSDDYGPVNVIVLRNSQVEGENVTIKDEISINTSATKNICPDDWTLGQYAPANGSIGIFQNRIRLNNLVLVEPNTEYYLDTFNSNYQLIIRTYLEDKTFSRNLSAPTTFTTNEDEYYVGITLYSASDTTSNLLELVADRTIKPFMCLNSEKDKSYLPFAITGEIEYVISDNPFAYTELKRKQLIEAGKRLFGFKYTPMTVDMLGLMYLNSKDRISVENLNGQKYSTYLFDHTIDYTGIVLDSMESKSKSKTETKYQYVSSLAQGLSHVEIKVDKANKRIESIIESQEDVSEKVAKTVVRIEVVYALSDSPTTAPTDGWSTTAPEWTAGKYMWQKTITTYANGTTAETAATNISGAKGEAGQNGIGITQTNITYQKSTSGTTVPTGTWQTTIPEVDEDGYLWTRTEFIYSDGSKKYAYNVGKKGATGIGVKSIIDQYYSSTSSTELAGGEWKETQDTLQTNRFIWTRSKITWTNESVTYTDPILSATLNDINSNIIVFKEFTTTQIIENGKITDRVQETTKRLNNDYSTTEQVDSKVDKVKEDVAILAQKFVDVERTAEEYVIKINEIDNNGVDKIKTRMGYTFNDEGLKIDRPGADTSTIIDEAKIKVTDKTGSEPKSLLYAGYVKEGDTEFSDYEGQTIVATSNLIVQNFLIIGSNSRFQDYYNETLGGNGTGAFDI